MRQRDKGQVATRQDNLVERIKAGFEAIDEAVAKGDDLDAWEQFWRVLLDEYNVLCDELTEIADV